MPKRAGGEGTEGMQYQAPGWARSRATRSHWPSRRENWALDVAGLDGGCFDAHPVEGEGGHGGRIAMWFRAQGEGVAQDHEVLGGVEFTGELPAQIGV